MKKLLFAMLLAVVVTGVQAKPVDVATAKSLGVKFMNTNTEIKSAVAELTYTALADNGQAAFYVFGIQPKGFVIVSADDRAKPILGYSTESNFSAQLPDGLMTFFDNYKAGFSQMFANNDERTAEAVADWECLAATGRLSNARTDRSVGPLLASIWNQTDLYNNMAPEDPTSIFSGHCKSGCVANTMSQLMRYWEWPRHGEGSHGYYANTYYGNYGWQEASFADATYRFELMPDFLDFASPQAEVDATALLEYHAGVGVDMMYGPNASGAYSQNVPDAFRDYFRYSPDMYLTALDYYGLDEWNDMLRANLDAGMPFYYASSGPDGGHAYVLDGYEDFDMFHLNWGWAGFDNGYFSIDGFYLTFYSFPWDHVALFNLHPDDEYYDAPMAVEDDFIAPYPIPTEGYPLYVDLYIAPAYQTRNGAPITELDSVVIMRDGEVVMQFDHVSSSHVSYRDYVDKNGTYYYTVYAVNEAGHSKVTRDTIMVGPTCNLRFELVDSGDNGWDLSSIAVLDEDGKVSQRVGLWEGGSATLYENVPSDQTATFFWTYDNTCYSHGSLSEVSYEIYDWNDNLIVASNGYPEVGEIIDYEIGCITDCRAVSNLDGKYQWNSADEFGVELTWEWDGNVADFQNFAIYRNDLCIALFPNTEVQEFFDVTEEVGTMIYSVVVNYAKDNGETCQSNPVSVNIEVTGIDEAIAKTLLYPNPASDSFTVEGNVKEIKVFDALGQMIYQGETNTVEVHDWNNGVYLVRVEDENDTISTVKFVKQ
ncbi:MAG: thiol protease/hemagglutinin PrtT [Bacteroidales bacterium]|nr:thiol protease/hemagglutinin PrtT [Bacteroidales bacterium]